MTTEKNTDSAVKDERSELEKLNGGLLMLYFQREIEDSAYAVINRIKFGHVVMQKRQSYVSELMRVFEELELTAEMLKELTVEATKNVNGKVKQPEEIIEYYNGIFLGLVHQAKDKLLRFLDYMAADENVKTAYKEAKKVSLDKHKEILEQIGILDLVNEWKQGSGPLGVILKKRTQHHHFISTTRLNDDLQKLKMTRTALAPHVATTLNKAGREYMEKLGRGSFDKYRNDIVRKQKHALGLIRNNLNGISGKIITHYDIPSDVAEQARFANEYLDYLSSLEIKNETAIEKMPFDGILTLDDIITLPNDLKGEVISIYGVGSYFRGEFIQGSSDVNIYIITKKISTIHESEAPVTLHVISEEEFLSDDFKKEQFICWSDGVLLQGKQHKWSERDFPKPGTILSLLLNRGVIETLESIKEEIELLQNPTSSQLRLLQLRATKKMLDYLFGIAMSNKPLYTASRKGKIQHMKEVLGILPLILSLEDIYFTRGMVVEPNNFCDLIDVYLNTARKNYAKQEKIEQNLLSKSS